jgi:hypothetical protein
MQIQSAGSAFRQFVAATIRAAQARLAGPIASDMSSYGHTVALTSFGPFIAGLAEEVCKLVGWKRSHASMIRAARLLHRAVDSRMGQAARQSACRAGCFFCCMQPVEASLPEILLLADHLRGRLAPTELDAVRARCDAYLERVDDNPAGPALCPLNVDGRCVAYEARPLACRGYNALDAADCEARLHKGTERPIRYIGEPVALARAADLALQVATRYHFPDEAVSGFPLAASLRHALDHPGATSERAFVSGSRRTPSR